MDHPRSRGVYQLVDQPPVPAAGSSPLARGLPVGANPTAAATGIIPARAGFTERVRRQHRPVRDHPRSRGVYDRIEMSEEMAGGSSPLARGLHRDLNPGAPLTRIIPARAGFTGRRVGGAFEHGDHPRSRGVYLRPLSRRSRRPGSSPLARGLLIDCGGQWALAGIIPARAGFTSAATTSRGRAPDHPRSRGVYVDRLTAFPSVPGSSPLARGLPQIGSRCTNNGWIIPARAGFTTYPTLAGVTLVGSSPLARGLPGAAVPAGRLGGIIPARAGFTSSVRPPP